MDHEQERDHEEERGVRADIEREQREEEFAYEAVALDGRNYRAVIGPDGIVITGGLLDDPARGDARDFANRVADTLDAVFGSVCEALSIADLTASRAMAQLTYALTTMDDGVRITPHGVRADGFGAGELPDLLDMIRETALSEQWVRVQIANAAHYNRVKS